MKELGKNSSGRIDYCSELNVQSERGDDKEGLKIGSRSTYGLCMDRPSPRVLCTICAQ